MKVKDTFLDTIERVYQADIAGMDFFDGKSASAQINDWVSNKTDRMIQEIIQPGQLEPSTQMLLINSILFDYKWAKQYSEHQVIEGKFNGQDEVNEVQYLNSKEYSFIETDNTIGTIKPYQGGRYRFVGLMPKDSDADLYDFVQSLTPDKLKNIRGPRPLLFSFNKNRYSAVVLCLISILFKFDIILTVHSLLKQI